MKIQVTEHEKMMIVVALQAYGTTLGDVLASKILAQSAPDPADDGPEVELIRALRNQI
jgi:DNA-directed RNA polymerase subunit L